jgi:hypothetical protein
MHLAKIPMRDQLQCSGTRSRKVGINFGADEKWTAS